MFIEVQDCIGHSMLVNVLQIAFVRKNNDGTGSLVLTGLEIEEAITLQNKYNSVKELIQQELVELLS